MPVRHNHRVFALSGRTTLSRHGRFRERYPAPGPNPRIGSGLRSVSEAATAGAVLAILACGGPSGDIETDLARALDLATVTAETAEVQPGNYEQRVELLSGWSAPEETEEGAFARNAGPRARLRWQLAWPRALELVLTGRNLTVGANQPVTVRVSWNDETLGELDLSAGTGMEEHRLQLPAAVQRTGGNEVELHHFAHAGLGAVEPTVAWSRLRIEGAGAGARPAVAADGSLRLPFHSAVDYYVLLPAGGTLELNTELYGPQGAWRNAEPAPGLRASAYRFATGPPIVTKTLTEGRGRLTLPAHESPLRVRLEPSPGARVPQAEAGLLVSALLHSPTPIWPHAVSLPEAGSDKSEPTPPDSSPGAAAVTSGKLPHILIFLVDTLRADHLGCYGYERPTSPNIDRFAADAVLFEHPVAQSSWTRPATASILTGLYPHNHGARTRNQKLGEDIPYLPEVLRSLGYRALGVTTNGNAGPRFGFRRGFSHFKHMQERATRPGIHVPVWRAVDETLEWLERIGPEDSFFVFLHVTDPHAPYLPPERLRRQFAPSAPPGPGILNTKNPAGASHSTKDLRDLYDAEIALVDEHFGRMLEELDRRGFLDDTLVVFVADHGEEFQDHGHHGHGATLYQEQIHVPLIVRLPGGLRRPEDRSLVEAQVQQIDIVPTILDSIGHTGRIETDGRSLLPLIRAGNGVRPSSVAMAELRLDGLAMDAVLLDGADRRHKLIDHKTLSGTDRQLFDTSRDRAELNDLGQESLWAGYLATIGKLLQRGSGPLTAGVEPAMPAEQREALKALGYLD